MKEELKIAIITNEELNDDIICAMKIMEFYLKKYYKDISVSSLFDSSTNKDKNMYDYAILIGYCPTGKCDFKVRSNTIYCFNENISTKGKCISYELYLFLSSKVPNEQFLPLEVRYEVFNLIRICFKNQLSDIYFNLFPNNLDKKELKRLIKK